RAGFSFKGRKLFRPFSHLSRLGEEKGVPSGEAFRNAKIDRLRRSIVSVAIDCPTGWVMDQVPCLQDPSRFDRLKQAAQRIVNQQPQRDAHESGVEQTKPERFSDDRAVHGGAPPRLLWYFYYTSLNSLSGDFLSIVNEM